MIIRVRRPNYFPAVSDKFCSGKRLVKACRAWAVDERDYFTKAFNKDADADFSKAFNFIEKSLPDTKRSEDNLFYKFSFSITEKFMEKIRRLFVYSPHVDNDENVILPELNSSFKDSGGIAKKLPTMYRDSLLSHNRDLIYDVIGGGSVSHIQHVNNYRKRFSGMDLKNLFSQKLKIAKIFSAYLNRGDGNYDFVFTKSEIKYLRNLAAKYDAISILAGENGIHTKAIETFLFSDIRVPLKGERLPNGDIVIGRTKVLDKKTGKKEPAILSFASTNIGYRFKLYRAMDDLIEEKDKLRRQFNYYLRTDNVNGINKLNNKIANSVMNTGIAEVFVNVNNREKMQKTLNNDSTLSSAIIDDALGKDEEFYYVHNLANFDPERYYNVSLPLISAMKKFGLANKINTAFIEALAFGKVQHSPVALYLRAGCTPLNVSREEIENQIYGNPQGFDYKKNVWLKYNIMVK